MKNYKTAALLMSSLLFFGCDESADSTSSVEEEELLEEESEPEASTGNSVLLVDDSETIEATDTTEEITGDTPELRLELDSAYSTGKASANLMYASDETKTAYFTLYGQNAQSSYLIADVMMDEGNTSNDGYVGIFLRNDETYGKDLTMLDEYAVATWTNVSIEWDNTVSVDHDGDGTSGGEYYVTIGDAEYGPFDMNVSEDVQYVTLKVGDNSSLTASDTPLYIDDFIVYSDTDGTTEIHSDNFDNETVGADLTGTGSYSSNGYNAVVSDAQNATASE